MKKFAVIVNWQTLIVVCISFVSCFLTIKFQFTMYADFLIFGLLIAFPITLTTKEAFRRRERAIQYLTLFKASLQSVYYTIINSKLEQGEKESFKNLVAGVTDTLIGYLKSENPGDVSPVHLASDRVASFVMRNKKALKGSMGEKILFFLVRVNDSIEFLLATKRHRTPKGLNLVVKIATYLFVTFYPATMLHKTPDETLLSLFLSSVIKSVFLISLINVQEMLEDPFKQQGTDNILLGDFVPTTRLRAV